MPFFLKNRKAVHLNSYIWPRDVSAWFSVCSVCPADELVTNVLTVIFRVLLDS